MDINTIVVLREMYSNHISFGVITSLTKGGNFRIRLIGCIAEKSNDMITSTDFTVIPNNDLTVGPVAVSRRAKRGYSVPQIWVTYKYPGHSTTYRVSEEYDPSKKYLYTSYC